LAIIRRDLTAGLMIAEAEEALGYKKDIRLPDRDLQIIGALLIILNFTFKNEKRF